MHTADKIGDPAMVQGSLDNARSTQGIPNPQGICPKLC